MIQGIEGFEAKLQLHALRGLEVLEESEIEFVHAAGPYVAPSRRIVAHVSSKILVDTVACAVSRRRNPAVPG